MFRPYMWAIFRLWFNLQSSYTRCVGCSFRVTIWLPPDPALPRSKLLSWVDGPDASSERAPGNTGRNSRWIQNSSGRGGEDKFYPDRKSNSDHSVCSQCFTICTLPSHETVSVLRNLIDTSDLLLSVRIRWVHAVAQLVETQCYKLEDRGFGCR